jgi:hypothetical protein
MLDLGKREGVSLRIGLDAGPCATAHAGCSCDRLRAAGDLASAAAPGTARVSQLLHCLSLGSELTLAPAAEGFVLEASPER